MFSGMRLAPVKQVLVSKIDMIYTRIRGGAMLPARAKVFWSGPSQAVRLPKAFRFTTGEVTVRKVGDALILEPAPKQEWPVGYAASFANMPDDFERPEPLPSSNQRDSLLEAL
jgi:antitoxin VapB